MVVHFKGESGEDFEGLRKERFSLFWNGVEREYFCGDLMVPCISSHKKGNSLCKYKIIRKILDHTLSQTSQLLIKFGMCRMLKLVNGDVDIAPALALKDSFKYVTVCETFIKKSAD